MWFVSLIVPLKTSRFNVVRVIDRAVKNNTMRKLLCKRRPTDRPTDNRTNERINELTNERTNE